MTGDQQLRHLAYRHEWAQRYIAEPQNFKVCEQCRSVSFTDAGICRVCGTYRFNDSPEYVIETAKLIGSSPFPVTAGVVPRLAAEVIATAKIIGSTPFLTNAEVVPRLEQR